MPSMRVVGFGKSTPNVNGAFVASSASVIGNVQIGANSSVWYGAVVRGDVNSVKIGENVTVGDRAMLHCSGGGDKNAPLVVGSNVTVKAGAIVHGCTVADGCVIGEGAQIMDGASMGKNAMVGPGSIVAENKVVPPGQLWAGVPAKYQRDISPEEIAAFAEIVQENVEMALLHSSEDAKAWDQIEDDLYDHEQDVGRSEYYFQRLSDEAMQFKIGEVENHSVPGRILDTEISAREHKEPRPDGTGGMA
jgi:carbonic anhydrase/acetyltransferase-like protein (isoleucine patch superfamily)